MALRSTVLITLFEMAGVDDGTVSKIRLSGFPRPKVVKFRYGRFSEKKNRVDIRRILYPTLKDWKVVGWSSKKGLIFVGKLGSKKTKRIGELEN